MEGEFCRRRGKQRKRTRIFGIAVRRTGGEFLGAKNDQWLLYLSKMTNDCLLVNLVREVVEGCALH